MTTYIRTLFDQIQKKYGKLSNEALVEKLFEIGVIDHRLCKILAIREYVWAAVKKKHKKIESMQRAANHFCCTYEYVRKCMYYYNDLNF